MGYVCWKMIPSAKSFVGQLPILLTFYDMKLIFLRISWKFQSFGSGGEVMLVGELEKEKEKSTECNLQCNSFANYTLT